MTSIDFTTGSDSIPGGTTYGDKTNTEILAIASPSDLENVYSTTHDIVYTYYSSGNDGAGWYSTGGGKLI